MKSIEYGSSDFNREAWAAIDRTEPFKLIVRGSKCKALKRALSFYREYFEARKRGEKKKRLAWFKYGFYGFRMPVFWGIYNHAEMNGMSITTEETDDALIISFLRNS